MVPGDVGSGVLQRTQLRSPGGLATPHAGFVQMFGASSDSWAPSCWSKKPQSMHAMAPGNSALPQAGHALDVPPLALAAASALETDGRLMDGAEDTAAEEEAAVAPTVCSSGGGGGGAAGAG